MNMRLWSSLLSTGRPLFLLPIYFEPSSIFSFTLYWHVKSVSHHKDPKSTEMNSLITPWHNFPAFIYVHFKRFVQCLVSIVFQWDWLAIPLHDVTLYLRKLLFNTVGNKIIFSTVRDFSAIHCPFKANIPSSCDKSTATAKLISLAAATSTVFLSSAVYKGSVQQLPLDGHCTSSVYVVSLASITHSPQQGWKCLLSFNLNWLVTQQ